MMDVYEAIRNRRTIREFEDKKVPDALVEKIIGAGLMAPTNDHLRNWEFVVVSEQATRADLLKIGTLKGQAKINNLLDSWGMSDDRQRAMYHQALPLQYSMLYNAGCLILPFFKVAGGKLKANTLSALNPFASIWCCIENMLIAAAAEGVFGVTRIPMQSESEHIQQVIGHPSDYIMPCYIALGYPAQSATRTAQKGVSVQERIHINTWSAK